MQETLSKMLSSLHNLHDFWNFPLITSSQIYITAGRLIISLTVWFLGVYIVRLSFKYIRKWLFSRHLKDENTLNWTVRFLKMLFKFILLVISALILGISPSIISYIWKLEIFSIQNSGISVGNIIIGLILIYPGLRFSRYLTKRFKSNVLEPLNLEAATRFTLESIIRYSLIAVVFLFILSIVGIPLGAFTLLGGALAIGIGFGSQNMVNNFLSGLILMIERPLSVNDIVEVENQRGVVERIGARSTIIRTFNNVRQVIPNSKLLENTFINWSLTDPYIRREITVGVAYGSPVEKVRDLLLDAIKTHPDVEKSPEPSVLFSDFGDSALIFTLRFWVRITKLRQMQSVDSDIRYAIDRLFRQENIEIPFPQRDVHLKMSKSPENNIEHNQERDK